MLLVMGAVLTFSLQPFVFGVMADAVHDREDLTASVRLLAVVLTLSMAWLLQPMVLSQVAGPVRRSCLSRPRPRDLRLAYAARRRLFFAINFNHRYARPVQLAHDGDLERPRVA